MAVNRIKFLIMSFIIWNFFILSAEGAYSPERYCGALLLAAKEQKISQRNCGITRGDSREKRIGLIFTGGSYGEGYWKIREALTAVNGKASFFLTGDFLKEKNFRPIIQDIIAHKDYLGPHSDSHYIPIDRFSGTVISHEFFVSDLQKNLGLLEKFGVQRSGIKYWILPNEDFNDELSKWSYKEGLKIFNFTKGTRANADYTADSEPGYVSNDLIYQSILDRHTLNSTGLNGFLLLFHIGVGEDRSNPFADRMKALLLDLKSKGYSFYRIDELLDSKIPY